MTGCGRRYGSCRLRTICLDPSGIRNVWQAGKCLGRRSNYGPPRVTVEARKVTKWPGQQQTTSWVAGWHWEATKRDQKLEPSETWDLGVPCSLPYLGPLPDPTFVSTRCRVRQRPFLELEVRGQYSRSEVTQVLFLKRLDSLDPINQVPISDGFTARRASVVARFFLGHKRHF